MHDFNEAFSVMRHGGKRQRRKDVPWWLKKLDVVRDELRALRFPRTAEEGLRQCAELSAASMGLFKEEVGKTLSTRDEGSVEMETCRLMARFSSTDRRWKAGRKETRGAPKRQ